tara:strand:- start:507 stop:692 length:186 start_codon:yes stop_codon:yes gene_type:complete
MDDVRQDIKEINEKLDKLVKHIDFVESTYTIIKSPMAYVCSKLTGEKSKLPEIQSPKKITD